MAGLAGRRSSKQIGPRLTGQRRNQKREVSALAKTKKIIVAGSLVIEAIYPRCTRSDSQKVRAAKKKASSEAQARMNRIYSYQKLELMLAANFPRPGSALVCTLTYDDMHLPKDKKEADAKAKRFRTMLSRARKAAGKELVMFWRSEHNHGNGRWHLHCVINSTGNDADLIRKLWDQGRNIELQPLRIDKDKNWETLARYLSKEGPERPGCRSWSYTRNAVKPEIESFTVPDDTQLQPPSGSTIIREASERTDYAAWKIVKYLAPGWERSRVKTRRRRRK